MWQVSGEEEGPEHSASSARVSTPTAPSTELLQRALDGWERFLDGFEGASVE